VDRAHNLPSELIMTVLVYNVLQLWYWFIARSETP
jgi:hypothetical protein